MHTFFFQDILPVMTTYSAEYIFLFVFLESLPQNVPQMCVLGFPFVRKNLPTTRTQAMSNAFGAFRAANMGEQEDAQEFLAFFLDQLHEELVEAKKNSRDFDGSGGGGPVPDCGGGGGRGGGQEEDAWLEVGKGGSKAVLNAPDPRRNDSRSSVVRFFFVVLLSYWSAPPSLLSLKLFCSVQTFRLATCSTQRRVNDDTGTEHPVT